MVDMDAGMLTARRRNLTLAVFNNIKAANKKDVPFDNSEYLYTMNTHLGQNQYYVKGKLEPTLNCPDVCACADEEPEPPVCLISPLVQMSLDAVLKLCATDAGGALGPTKGSFILYAFWFGVATGYNWIAGGPISGMLDNWNWDTRNRITNPLKQFLFMNSVLMSLIPNLFTNVFNLNDASGAYIASQLLNYGYTETMLSPGQYASLSAEVNAAADFNQWETAFGAWFSDRNTQAKSAVLTTISGGDLPNTPNNINADITASAQTISTWAFPTAWTPINLPSNTIKKYYTSYWSNIPSSLSNGDLDGVKAAANAYYTEDDATRDADIDAMLNDANPDTDEKKSIAEFWAGITNTVSPPGMMFWFWKHYMDAYNIAVTRGNTPFIYSGFHLALGLFEAGRVVWDLKFQHFQDRPIQEVRRRYQGQTINSWNGTISGEHYIPYQPYNFITPPFADFPSGHSAFSQIMANVMGAWFSPNIRNPPLQTITDLNLLSPAFNGVTQTNRFGTIVFPQGKSQVIGLTPGTGPFVPGISGVVPAAPVTLSWASWQDLADQAGISRQYGGIHPMAAHTGSQALANELFDVIGNTWGLPVSV